MPFLQTDVAAGANAYVQTQEAPLRLQIAQQTTQDVIQESHNNAQLSMYKLQAAAQGVADTQLQRDALSKLPLDPTFLQADPLEQTKRIQAVAMSTGVPMKDILALQKEGIEAAKAKFEMEDKQTQHQQGVLDQLVGTIKGFTSPDDAKALMENVKNKAGGKSGPMFDAAEKELEDDIKNDPANGFQKWKDRWSGDSSPLIPMKQQLENKRQQDRERHEREQEAAKNREIEQREAASERRFAIMMAGINKRGEDKDEDRKEKYLTSSMIRIQSAAAGREKTKEYDRLTTAYEEAQKKQISSWTDITGSDKAAVEKAKADLDKYNEDTAAKERSIISAQPAEIQKQLKEAYPELFERETKTSPKTNRGEVLTVINKSDYDKLESGTTYIGPDGKQAIKSGKKTSSNDAPDLTPRNVIDTGVPVAGASYLDKLNDRKKELAVN